MNHFFKKNVHTEGPLKWFFISFQDCVGIESELGAVLLIYVFSSCLST